MSGWGHELALIWTNNVAPSRPSVAEMCVYTRYLRILQQRIRRQARVLVLGSTPEFRDWCYDENLVLHVVDSNQDYYDTVSREIRHKNITEELHISRWEDMSFPLQFDIIIGDLAIGNVDPERFDDFLNNVDRALAQGGLFIGKSFIWSDEEPIIKPKEIIDLYDESCIHPYTYINHQLALYCLDRNNYLLDFSQMYRELAALYNSGYIGDKLFSYFTKVGWNTEMKFHFFAPSQKYFVQKINEHLQFLSFEHTMDIYTNVFPIYVAQKRIKEEKQ